MVVSMSTIVKSLDLYDVCVVFQICKGEEVSFIQQSACHGMGGQELEIRQIR
jgi:hypothetical protein